MDHPDKYRFTKNVIWALLFNKELSKSKEKFTMKQMNTYKKDKNYITTHSFVTSAAWYPGIS